MTLKKYHTKRNFSKTPEPRGKKVVRKKLKYVMHKHDASHLHYDLRLAWDGVLKSWAIPKGPSRYPKEKRLAVEVEDHPLQYGSFEGIIPEGEYGGGTVMLWDKGTWEPLNDPKEGLKKGKLIFLLHGEKLKGEWTLVRMASSGSKNQWLLIKKEDKEAKKVGNKALLNTPSVKTGRTLKAIAEKAVKKSVKKKSV